MKKLCFIMLVISISCLSAISTQADDKFINALRTCSPSYKESGNIDINGITALSAKSLSGWHDNKCVYKETLKFNGMNVTTTCNFAKSHIKEITRVADAYYLTLRYSSEKPDTSSFDSIKNNPLANVLNKYLQDPSVCSMNSIQ